MLPVPAVILSESLQLVRTLTPPPRVIEVIGVAIEVIEVPGGHQSREKNDADSTQMGRRQMVQSWLLITNLIMMMIHIVRHLRICSPLYNRGKGVFVRSHAPLCTFIAGHVSVFEKCCQYCSYVISR